MADLEDFAAWPRHTLAAHSFRSPDEIAAMRTQLLGWYRAGRRRLPWRGDGPDGSVPTPVSPYGTWVSEVMLQQTRVEAVIEHYNKWMARFPTVAALAAADIEVRALFVVGGGQLCSCVCLCIICSMKRLLAISAASDQWLWRSMACIMTTSLSWTHGPRTQEVNGLWAGLGYYRRARMLHEGAKKVMSDFGGELPSDLAKLKSIPGIGVYTAGPSRVVPLRLTVICLL